MAKEIQEAGLETGNVDYYARVWNEAGDVWNNLSAAYENYDAGNIALYGADAGSGTSYQEGTEEGATGRFSFNSSATSPYQYEICEQAGASPAEGDAIVASGLFHPSNFSSLGIESDGHAHADLKEWLGTAPLALSSQQVQSVVPVTQKVDVETIKTQAVTLSGGVTIPAATLASTTNITAGTITTCTTNTDMRGTDNAALASVCTEARLAELDAANLPADIADIPTVAEFEARTLVAASYFDPAADAVANVTTVATTTNLTNLPTIPTNWITADGIAANAIGASELATDAVEEIADQVWDEVLTGATHNVAASSGRRLRQLASSIISDGTAQAGTVNSITLAAGESASDSIYAIDQVVIVAGTGIGQTRVIVAYDGTTKVARVNRQWTVTPDDTSEYSIVANANTEVIDIGTLQAATSMSATLRAGSSGEAGSYIGGNLVTLTNTGREQIRQITAYNESTKVATIDRAWGTDPDSTTDYAIFSGAGAVERGTDSAALASVCTETRLAELDAANLPTDIDAILVDTNSLNDAKIPDTISLANINAQVDTALTDYDAPTNAEMVARTLAAADYFDPAADAVANVTTVTTLTNLPSIPANWLTAAGIAASALNGKGDWLLSSSTGSGFTAIPWNANWDTEVESEVTDALVAIHLDHLLAVDYDPAAKPGTATALLNELVEDDGGVSRYTANALEQAPAGGGGGLDLATMFTTDTGETYGSAVVGSVVKEIADNAGGSAPAGPGDVPWEICVNNQSGNPIGGVAVWVTTDIGGVNIVAGTLFTDDFGKVMFMLNVGTYYLWRNHANHNFTNPKVMAVS